jgi:hypothetical protein
VALAALLVNDHYLKHHFHGLIPGKVSDVAGLVFFPLLLMALVEAARKLAGVEGWPLSRATLAVCIGITALTFIAVKASPQVAHQYSGVLGLLAQSPLRVRADLTDLFALPALALAWYVGSDERAMEPLLRSRR